MARTALRWTLRALETAVAGVGAYLLYVGASSLWMAAQLFPWPWAPPAGLAAPAVLIMVLLMGGGGLLVTTLGGALLATAWLLAGRLGPPWRRRRLARPPHAA
jgi:hypothetical protein